MKKSGFTLIEVVLAMTIMAFLTVMVSQAMRRSADFKTKIQKNIDHRSALNSAMRIIERDINLAFHYQDVNTEVLKEIEKKKKSGAAGGSTVDTDKDGVPDSQDPDDDNDGIPDIQEGSGGNTAGNTGQTGNNQQQQMYANWKIREIKNFTGFKGAKESLHFTNLNNITGQPGEQVSDQQEVGYFVKSCKSIADPSITSSCLWRRTSSYLDDKVDEGGTESVLIENVKKFELRYFGKEKEDWVDNWDATADGQDENLKNKFPSAVEVTLTVEQNKKEVSAIRVVALRFPNNMEPQNQQQPGQGAPSGDGPSETDYSGDN